MVEVAAATKSLTVPLTYSYIKNVHRRSENTCVLFNEFIFNFESLLIFCVPDILCLAIKGCKGLLRIISIPSKELSKTTFAMHS